MSKSIAESMRTSTLSTGPATICGRNAPEACQRLCLPRRYLAGIGRGGQCSDREDRGRGGRL